MNQSKANIGGNTNQNPLTDDSGESNVHVEQSFRVNAGGDNDKCLISSQNAEPSTLYAQSLKPIYEMVSSLVESL